MTKGIGFSFASNSKNRSRSFNEPLSFEVPEPAGVACAIGDAVPTDDDRERGRPRRGEYGAGALPAAGIKDWALLVALVLAAGFGATAAR